MMPSLNRLDSSRSGESGLTLIECLVAIVVIAATTATIAPMLIFSVATRVQNQKTEQALQLAQAEIDKVKLIVEQGGDYGDLLFDNAKLLAAPSTTASIAAVAAPDNFISSTADVATVTEARKIDMDGDGDDDYVIQLFRTEGIEVAPQTSGVVRDTPIVFDIGVRVYDARVEQSGTALLTDEAALAFTSGEGERGRRPLAVLYSQIAQGDRNGSLCQYWEFTGSTPTGMQC